MYSSNVSASFKARPFGTLALGDFLADEARQAIAGRAGDVFDFSRAALGVGLFEGSAAHGDDKFLVAGFDRRDSVAGVDRAREGLVAFHRENVRDLHHVEQGGNARSDVFARGGGRRNERVMVAHEIDDQRRDVFGKAVLVRRIVGDMDLAHARDLRGLLCHGAAIRACDQQVDFAQLARGGNGCERGVGHAGIVVFDPNEGFHNPIPSRFAGFRRGP